MNNRTYKNIPWLFFVVLLFSCKSLDTGFTGYGLSYNTDSSVEYNSQMTVSFFGPSRGMLLTGTVKNLEGFPLPAHIRIYNKERQADRITLFAQSYANIDGEFILNIPSGKEPGEYEIVIYRGPEYEYFSMIVELRKNTITHLDINLARITDMITYGWYGGDIHQHSKREHFRYGSDGRNSMEEMAEANAAVGLHFGVLTDHNQNNGIANERFIAAGSQYRLDSGDLYFFPIGGVEVTTQIAHMNAWDPKTEDGNYYQISHEIIDNNAENRIANISRIADDIARHSILSIINHPSGNNGFLMPDFDWIENSDLILQFDVIEIWNGPGFISAWGRHYGSLPCFGTEDDPLHTDFASSRVSTSFLNWYRLLNTGVRFPMVGSSDSHNRYTMMEGGAFDRAMRRVKRTNRGNHPQFESFDQTVQRLRWRVGRRNAVMYALRHVNRNAIENLDKIPGTPRNYVYLGSREFNQENIADAIRNGHSFVTSGPLVKFEINGMMPGQTASLDEQQELTVGVISARPFNRIQIIADGELIMSIDTGDVREYNNTFNLIELIGKKWAILYVEGGDNFQFAVTNPIYFKSCVNLKLNDVREYDNTFNLSE
jgi:hypothetical protein